MLKALLEGRLTQLVKNYGFIEGMDRWEEEVKRCKSEILSEKINDFIRMELRASK